MARAERPPPGPLCAAPVTVRRQPLCLALQMGEEVAALPAARSQLRRWVQAALRRPARLTLRFVGLDEGQQLNRDYRGRDHPTNVLTFSYADDSQPPTGTDDEAAGPTHPAAAAYETDRNDDAAIADLVICLPVVAREAAEQGKTLRDHLAHMVVHGTLHAQGYDHEHEQEALAMEALERTILARFRIADPYAVPVGPQEG